MGLGPERVPVPGPLALGYLEPLSCLCRGPWLSGAPLVRKVLAMAYLIT